MESKTPTYLYKEMHRPIIVHILEQSTHNNSQDKIREPMKILRLIITNKELRSTCAGLVAYSGDGSDAVVAIVRVMLRSKKGASAITQK
jgi:hypothetical protein